MTPFQLPHGLRTFSWSLSIFCAVFFLSCRVSAETSSTGGILKVSEIRLEGCEAFTQRQLLKLMDTTPPKWHFWRYDYQPDVFEKDLTRITDFYHRRGYLQAEIEDKETALEKDGRSIRLTAWIFEGPLSHIKSLKWDGVHSLPDEKFRKLLPFKEGDPLDQDLLNATLKSIVKAYTNQGYLDAQVKPILAWDKDHIDADLLIDVKEGPLAHLAGFNIKGLERARDWVVWREFRMKPKDPLRWDKVELAQQRLYLTGIFQTLYVRPGAPKDDGLSSRTLNVDVQEGKGRQMNLSGGWGSADHFHGLAEVSDVDMLGRARKVSVLASASNILQHLEGNYGTPWTAGFPWFNNVNFFGERQHQPSFDLQRVGGILSIGKNFSAVSKFQVSYQHTNAYLAHVNILPAPDTNKDFIRSIKLSLVMDHRDSFTDAKEGYYLSSSAEMSGAFFHGTNTFLRTIHQVKVYHKISSSTVFASSAQVGWVGNYKSQDPLALSELFYAGGPDALRGFAYQCAGPLDSMGTPLGGQFELVLNAAEIRQHLWKFLGVVGFWDVGNVFTNIDRFRFHGLRTTGGWGLRISTPLGILRADQGFIVNPRPGEKRERISISVGQAF